MGKPTSAFHLCPDFKRCEVPLPHFCSALTAKDMKFTFRTSALPGLLKVRRIASAIPLCLYCQISTFHTSARPGLRRSRSSSALVLPGLPNMGKATSAFHLCRDFQRSEVPLLHFCFALTAKDVKFCFLSSAIRSHYAFPHTFVLSWSLERRNRNHLIEFSVCQAQKFFYMYPISSVKV